MFFVSDNIKGHLPPSLFVASGLTDGVSYVKKFGYNNNVSTLATIWDGGGLYQYLDTAQVVYLSSSSTNDTELGSGARTVLVSGLDENWLDVSETVTLNGQTPVVTQNTFIRVFRMKVMTAGVNAGAAGIVYCGVGTHSAGVPSHKLAQVTDGDNQTLMAMYTVPADKHAFIFEYAVNSGKSGEARVDSMIREYGGLFQIKRRILLYENSFNFSNTLPFYIPPRADIEIRAYSSVGAPISANFDVILVQDGYQFV